jgi:hypothetical protein
MNHRQIEGNDSRSPQNEPTQIEAGIQKVEELEMYAAIVKAKGGRAELPEIVGTATTVRRSSIYIFFAFRT